MKMSRYVRANSVAHLVTRASRPCERCLDEENRDSGVSHTLRLRHGRDARVTTKQISVTRRASALSVRIDENHGIFISPAHRYGSGVSHARCTRTLYPGVDMTTVQAISIILLLPNVGE